MERPDVHAPGLRLLALADALILRDRGPSGLSASVCLGVEIGEARTWWCASFGRHTETSFVQGASPPEADAVLLLGEKEAEMVLESGDLPAAPELLQFQGDRQLMKRFLNRYFEPQDLMSFRLKNR